MKRLSILFLATFLFIGCSQKEPTMNELPYYSKDKVNLYLLNNETVLSSQIEYIYTIESNSFNKNINICYAQYSYTQLEEGNYNIKVIQRGKISPFEDRTDHEYFNSFLKKGETYILRIDASYDIKSAGKLLVHNRLLDNSLDPKIKIVEVEKDKVIKTFEEMKNHTNIFGNRSYPLRAEDNNNELTCFEQAFKNAF